ncbi:protein O-mannosyl-transferase 2 [Neocloeon triangulifer]|uniref:protein O-mannosyl-transferase 2 n=1 Tax=Neocloeon triangulifer TaxID=2078957 RepID=UPI00286F64FA|nr:protein O-mannosyl-transferase 2 [Neocloeon triangulifer]
MSHAEGTKQAKKNNKEWWAAFGIIVLFTLLTRLHKIAEPEHVCWDETHFGKMGSWYINRTFFFDVHPPLGKMLIGLSGYLTGYDGRFAFEKPGDVYENVNYLGMRFFCTLMGAMTVPFSFLIVYELTESLEASVLASALFLLDVGLVTLNQYILLDPILLFFVMGSVLGMVKVASKSIKEFSFVWWFWLVWTGVMLAGSISVKFVGLFVVLLVGLHTICDLWEILGNTTKPLKYLAQHFFARASCLIGIPIFLYVCFFYIHLKVLNHSGNGDGFYSSAFQSQLIGNSLHNASMPREVAYGAVVSLKNHRTGGGYLHSHWHLYPEGVGARQQQITAYTHKDDNNKWVIRPITEETDASQINLLKHGNYVRLEHLVTRRNLHSHKEPAPMTRKHLQVTGYGENGTGDANDVWVVHIDSGVKNQVVQTVTSKFRLIHHLQKCVLTTSGKQLPKWGFEQQEVSCNPNFRDKSALWNIEDNYSPKLPNVTVQVYAPSFFERFLESHAVMLQGNAGLKPKEGEVTSKPWQWPINYKGQFFSGNQYRIYLLGNPVIWWGNLVVLATFCILYLWQLLKSQRSLETTSHEEQKLLPCSWLFIGWALHYVPFWVMGRVLYFHHYFPALMFNSMLSGVVLSYILDVIKNQLAGKLAFVVRHTILAFLASSLIYSFYLFAPLAYGMSGPFGNDPNSTMSYLRWLESWEI